MTEGNDAFRRFQAARTASAMRAARDVEPPCEDCPDPVTAAAVGDIPVHGDLVLYDTMTGDGRTFRQDAFSWDLDLEGIPILWDSEEGDHDGPIIGRVDAAANRPGAVFGSGRLFAFADDPDMQALVSRVTRLIDENAIGWSIRFDDEVAELTIKDPVIEDKGDGTQVVHLRSDDDVYDVTSARIRHLALVDTPAFPGARPILGPPPALAAAASVATFPVSHFEKWDSGRDLMPLQTTADGRFFGHAAGDGCFRNGSNACEKYTRDPDPTLANFHTGTATLDNGDVIRVGVLTAAGLHASTSLDVSGQRAHHENSTTVVAKVRAWEDRYGRLCVSGSMIPGLDPTFTAQVAGLPISVEKWPTREVNGLTCVGMHLVPTPAWPVVSR